MASDPALTLSFNLYQLGEHHLPQSGNSPKNLPHAIQILPEGLSATELNRQPAGEGRQRQNLGCLGTFANMLPTQYC